MFAIDSLDPKDFSVVVTAEKFTRLSAREAFELSVKHLSSLKIFLKLFFIDTLFPPVFFIAAHMLCPLCTSKQELLLQFLTV